MPKINSQDTIIANTQDLIKCELTKKQVEEKQEEN